MDDGTMALIRMAVLLFACVAAPFFGAESRPAWRDVNRKPRFRAVGSMRRSDWPRDEL
jgi:hypothetical protein